MSVQQSEARVSDNIDAIWAIAELLRGSFRSNDYLSVLLPFIILRRMSSSPAPESPLDWATLIDPDASQRLALFIADLSPAIKDVFDAFDFGEVCERLEQSALLGP